MMVSVLIKHKDIQPVTDDWLKKRFNLTDKQLNRRVSKDVDTPALANHFDNALYYCIALSLTTSEQESVRLELLRPNGNPAARAAKKALDYWVDKVQQKATFRTLNDCLLTLRLQREDICAQVLKHLSKKLLKPSLTDQPTKLQVKVQSTNRLLLAPTLNVCLLLLAFHLLLQSGDIESNPGPTMTEPLTLDDLHSVLTLLMRVTKDWFNLGLALGVHNDELRNIKDEHPSDNNACIRKMLTCRLIKKDPLTLTNVCSCLRQPTMTRNDVATEIEKQCSDPITTAATLSHKLSLYKDYLKDRYKFSTAEQRTQWPPAPTGTFYPLTIVQRDKIQRGTKDDDSFKLKITGKIDKIVKLTHAEADPKLDTTRNIDKILTTETEAHMDTLKPNFTLVQGASGSGKSRFAQHLCEEWAKGNALQKYTLVILVKLEDPNIKEAESLKDILPQRDSKMASDAKDAIIQSDGDGVLWILDGWDEIPQNSIIKMLFNEVSPVFKSSIIITSRPSSSATLQSQASSRIELLGFTSDVLEEYFTECLEGNLSRVQTLLEKIQENPELEGSCYLPLHASIVVNCFISNCYSFDDETNSILIPLVQCLLKRSSYVKPRKDDNDICTYSQVDNITSPHLLPPEIRTLFLQLCKLAFYEVSKNQVASTAGDLESIGIDPRKITALGLLQAVPSFIGHRYEYYFCFLHQSIQQLLAAIHVSQMTYREQIEVFQNCVQKPQLNVIALFYAAITKLQISRDIFSKLLQFFHLEPASIMNSIKKVIKKEQKNKNGPKPMLLTLIRCVTEAKDLSLCRFVASVLNNTLIPNTQMTPTDCHSVGYFVANTSKEFKLNLQHCSIGVNGCKLLSRGLQQHKTQGSTVKDSSVSLDLKGNVIDDQGLVHIISLLTNNSRIVEINLSQNEIGNKGLQILCEALLSNTTLKKLDISKCSLTISEDDIGEAALYQLLCKNMAIISLDMSENKIESSCKIAEGLVVNKTLKHLSLNSCELPNITDLIHGLYSIEQLEIRSNESLTTYDMQKLADHIINYKELKSVWIPSHLSFCIPKIFGPANYKRVNQLKLPKVIVNDSKLI